MMRILTLFLAAVFFCGLKAQNSDQGGVSQQVVELKDEQRALKKQIDESQDLLDITKRDVSSQLSSILLLSSQIDRQQAYVNGMAREADSLSRRIAMLQKQLKTLQGELDDCKRQFQRSLLYMHRNRTTENKLMFIFSAENFNQAYRRLRYVEEFAKYQRAQGEVLKQKEREVREAKARVERTKREKDRLLAQGLEEQKKLEGQKTDRESKVKNLKKQQKKLQGVIAQQQKKYNQLNARIEKIIQEEIAAAERRRKEEERKRKEAEARAKREAAKKNATKKDGAKKEDAPAERTKQLFNEQGEQDKKLSSNFASNRGRLPMPITGPYLISSRFGSNSVAGLKGVRLDNKGINITGKKGAKARCVFDGEVTSVFSFGGLKNVIVRHGSYITVYCNLSSTSVRLGQKVKTKQVLGTIATDESGNCTLQFQLRKEKLKLNPEPWLAK